MPASDPPAVLEPEVFRDTSLLITEDGKPVDNQFVEIQYRLLTEPLLTSWKHAGGLPFRVLANVGLFFEYRKPPLVPDTMFALGVAVPPRDIRETDNRSYFMWIVRKPPDVVIEIVSDKCGGEDTEKLADYARIKVPFYVIFDPDEELDGGVLRAFELSDEKYKPTDPSRFGELGLGLTLWDGEVEGATDTWSRWIDSDGKLVPNAKERTDADEARIKVVEANSKAAETRIKHLEDKLRAAGLSPNGLVES